MNLDAYRENNIEESFVKVLTEYHFSSVAPDQDYLNFLCKGKVKYVNRGWDRMPNIDEKFDDNTLISGCTYGKLYMLNVKKREFTLLDEKAHCSFIRAIVVLKNNMFITGADDSNCSLKLWKFNC